MTSIKYSSDDQESVKHTSQAFKKGNTHDDVITHYKEWVKNGQYMQDTDVARYRGHTYVHEDVEKIFPTNRDKVRVIDLGAGTGRVAVELAKKGFKLMDALEPCEEMVVEAKKLGLYQNFILDPIGYDQLPIKENTYDLALVAGAMGEGHIPPEAMHEMARIVKPGGLISIIMREAFLNTCTQYAGRLEPLMKKMEEDGEWKLVSRVVKPDYFLDIPGVVFRYSPC